ncbi:CoA transferase [Burkholderia sp. FERM BP-3421]|jgi:crotonobetainyl-CoA:carnitine CoA-transferase CaiB-like acyl-CoA transferase|uniref:CaiB/BaiF CoA transferase family protein n=1 Tax=Burkholderia sp. FERM BP-3421 TaxID=1494466 RepID=UPI0023603B35|nr:CoA transferase [Burkholderia sp. FERM BP-3421]WDD91559.1 CoA transferase [Burkholderia sp. FERM BP-3421]
MATVETEDIAAAPAAERARSGPLDGIRVIDAATLFAGPLAATMLADYGADVIKVEHPTGDPARKYGARRDDVPLWWKVLARNKRAVTLNLSDAEGQRLFRELAAQADVVVENFRPGTLERWGLGYDALSAVNPRLVLVRVTGFGQFGPYSSRPGFGTLAEAMSGLAALTGEQDGPPLLPSFPLADTVAGLTAAFAIMTALKARERTGRGQVVDLAIIETMLAAMGAQVTSYDQTGQVPVRTGNRSANNSPRGVYRTADGKWVALSTSAQSIAERVMRLVGRADLIDEPWFVNGAERARHADELDEAVGGWIARRTRDEVLDEFERAEAAVAPIYDVTDVLRDPQYAALGSVVSVPDAELGAFRTHNVPFRLSDTPGAIRWGGPRRGAHNDEVFGALGLERPEIAALTERGVL